MPLVSIIVPIYNSEKYLKKCIESILNQTLKDIEIILVNDGSTDESIKIINKYANIDSRIKVINKKNEGQAKARNIGIELANSKYIGFVDSDDWIQEDMYKKLYKEIENQSSDLVVCSRESYNEIDNSYVANVLKNEIIEINKNCFKKYLLEKVFYKQTFSTCNKLYKRELINNYSIRFKDVNEVGSEDALFNYQYILFINRISQIEYIGYTQLSRRNSTATTYKFGYMNRLSNMLDYMEKWSIDKKKYDVYQEVAGYYLLILFQWSIKSIKAKNKKNYRSVIEKELNEVFNKKSYTNAIRLLLDNEIESELSMLGFSNKGILYIKIIFNLILLKNFKLVSKLVR